MLLVLNPRARGGLLGFFIAALQTNKFTDVDKEEVAGDQRNRRSLYKMEE
jgi:hypothetical protein